MRERSHRNFWNKRDVLPPRITSPFLVLPMLVTGEMERFDVFTNHWLGAYFLTVPNTNEWTPVWIFCNTIKVEILVEVKSLEC